MLFSHDGIHDSQTHLASPAYFYEQLRGEISYATRSGNPIALIKVVFENPKSEQVRAADILHFSFELAQLTRREDCIGRLGINEVVIIVREGEQHADLFLQRLIATKSLSVNNSLQIKFGLIYGQDNEDALKMLDRLDREEMISI